MRSTRASAAIARLTLRNPNPSDGEPHYQLGLALRYQGKTTAAYAALYKSTWNQAWAGPAYHALAELDSVEFCSMLVRDCNVALSPGVGFGPGGEGYARFALIENEQRIQQGLRNLRKGLTKLG